MLKVILFAFVCFVCGWTAKVQAQAPKTSQLPTLSIRLSPGKVESVNFVMKASERFANDLFIKKLAINPRWEMTGVTMFDVRVLTRQPQGDPGVGQSIAFMSGPQIFVRYDLVSKLAKKRHCSPERLIAGVIVEIIALHLCDLPSLKWLDPTDPQLVDHGLLTFLTNEVKKRSREALGHSSFDPSAATEP